MMYLKLELKISIKYTPKKKKLILIITQLALQKKIFFN